MSYVDDLRSHLVDVRDGRVRQVELEASQRVQIEQALLRWCEAGSKRAKSAREGLESLYFRWSQPELLHDAIETLHDRIGALSPFEPETLIPAIGHALAWILAEDQPGLLQVPASPWSPLRTQTLERIAEAVGMDLLRHLRAGRPQPRRYARQLGLVHTRGARTLLTTSGTLALELPGPSMVLWLLALERAQTTGPEDLWHADETVLRRLLSGSLRVDHHDNAFAPLHERGERRAELATLRRLQAFGLVTREGPATPSTAEPNESFELTQSGHATLADLFGEPESPLSLLARAVSEDQTAEPPVKLLAAASREVSAVTDAARHMRMIAHEIRNALVPVQVAFDHLWRRVASDPLPPGVDGYRETVLAGLRRMFRFVDESARIARMTPTPPEPFDAVGALGDAVDALHADFSAGVEHEARYSTVKGPPLLVGHRDRFIMAAVNLLRNAIQANATSAKIETSVDEPSSTLTILVDDDGSGVRVEHRSDVFKPGFSLRDGGSGHGLALVREVVEDELHGTITCTESPLGGARFCLQIPLRTTAGAR